MVCLYIGASCATEHLLLTLAGWAGSLQTGKAVAHACQCCKRATLGSSGFWRGFPQRLLSHITLCTTPPCRRAGDAIALGESTESEEWQSGGQLQLGFLCTATAGGCTDRTRSAAWHTPSA